jgi:excisionase family DNA binding protein
LRPFHFRIKEIGLIFNLFPWRKQKGGGKMAASADRDFGKGRVMTSALLTVPEAARYLGVGRKKVYELIEWGELKAVKLGRSVQVQKDSLDRFRESGKLT